MISCENKVHTVKPLLSRCRGLIYFKLIRGGDLNRDGGDLFNLEKTMASVLHKELEYKVEKLKLKKVMQKVMQLRIIIKSELPVSK